MANVYVLAYSGSQLNLKPIPSGNSLSFPATNVSGYLHSSSVSGVSGLYYWEIYNSGGYSTGFGTIYLQNDNGIYLDKDINPQSIHEIWSYNSRFVNANVTQVSGQNVELSDFQTNLAPIISGINNLSSEHSDILDAINSIIEDSSLNKITVTVKDNYDTLLNGIPIEVVSPSGIKLGKFRNTNSLGQAIFRLESGNYKVLPGDATYYNSPDEQSISVSGNLSVDFTYERLVYTSPLNPALCRVIFNVYKNGIPVSGAIVKANLKNQNCGIDQIILDNTITQNTTDGSGYAYLDLVRKDQFTSGKPYYEFIVEKSGTVISNVIMSVPNNTNISYEELVRDFQAGNR